MDEQKHSYTGREREEIRSQYTFIDVPKKKYPQQQRIEKLDIAVELEKCDDIRVADDDDKKKRQRTKEKQDNKVEDAAIEKMLSVCWWD